MSVQVKICGITSPKDAQTCLDAGADYLGFNFWKQSKRYLKEDNREWLPELKDQIKGIGLFVDAPNSKIIELHRKGYFDTVQLHGSESIEAVNELNEKGIPVIKALGISNQSSLRQIDRFASSEILLDYHNPAQPDEKGGTGKRFDWILGKLAVSEYPKKRFFLAGGLQPENVAEAITTVQPYAVDVASGVESAPGIKDPALVESFVQAAKAA